jgi:hypothetical protein
MLATGSWTSSAPITLQGSITSFILPEHLYEVTYNFNFVGVSSGVFSFPLTIGPQFNPVGTSHELVTQGVYNITGPAGVSVSLLCDDSPTFVFVPEPSTLTLVDHHY